MFKSFHLPLALLWGNGQLLVGRILSEVSDIRHSNITRGEERSSSRSFRRSFRTFPLVSTTQLCHISRQLHFSIASAAPANREACFTTFLGSDLLQFYSYSRLYLLTRVWKACNLFKFTAQSVNHLIYFIRFRM